MILMRCLIASLFVSLVSSHQPEDNLKVDSELTGKVSSVNTYEVDYRIVVTAPYKSKSLKVWVPVPTSDKAQKISNVRFSTFPSKVEPQFHVEKKFGNKFAYFEFKNPPGAQIIRFQFDAEVGNMNWNLDLSKVQKVKKWPKEFQVYLRNEFDRETKKQLESVLSNALPKKNNNGLDVQAILQWTDDNLTYSHTNASLKGDAKHAMDQKQGHCSDYHGLCSALGRELGYPARVTYGLATFDKASPSHCKLEVFLPPHGWVIFDVSETQKLIKLVRKSDLDAAEKKKRISAIRDRLLSGYRDNTWLQVTRGTNFSLAPAASQKTVPLIRTIYAEADGKPLPEPDPSNASQKKFSWMTAYQVKAKNKVKYPYKDIEAVTGK